MRRTPQHDRRISLKARPEEFQPIAAKFPPVVPLAVIMRLALVVLAERIDVEGIEKVMAR